MRSMNRREFVKVSGAAAGASLLASCGLRFAGSSSQTVRPNLLFVYADQWRRMAMSHYRGAAGYNMGDPVNTPNLDRFAKEGMIFNSAVACSPVCSPNRATLMTGLYPATHGLVLNEGYERFTTDTPTIAHVLSAHGYETGHIGKWHMAMTLGYQEGVHKRGFAYWYGAPGCNHAHFDAALHHHPDEVDGQEQFTRGGEPLPNPFIPSFHYKNMSLRIEESWNPNHLTRKALDYLKNAHGVRDTRKPFALYLSFNPPHTIHGWKPKDGNIGSWHIAGKRDGPGHDEYWGNNSDHPPDYDYRAPIEFEKRYRTGGNWNDPVRSNLPMRPNVPQDHYSRTKCLPGYFGAVDAIDVLFGKVMGYLDKTPDPRCPEYRLRDTTLVVVTADHGEMMGSHGLMTKDVPLEESIGVPLMIRWPGVVDAGESQDIVFNSVHVVPTILGLLGLGFETRVDGTDYSGAILGEPDAEKPETAFLGLRNWRAVRTQRYLYVARSVGSERRNVVGTLYDMQEDPFQMRPIRENRRHQDIMRDFHSRLCEHLRETEDEIHIHMLLDSKSVR